jgi:glycosyltransferase involved in cell wall biosynthesis
MAQNFRHSEEKANRTVPYCESTQRLATELHKIKVVHVITGLDVGGAEMMLYQLLAHINRTQFDSEVISLTDIGLVGQKIQSLGVPVRALGMNRNGLPSPMLIPRLARWLREMRPQVVQTWMYHADLVGTLAAWLAGDLPIIWNIQHGPFRLGSHNPRTLRVAKVCGILSRRLSVRVVSCSTASYKEHQELGYAADKIQVIPNGSNTVIYHPNAESRRAVRRELNIANEIPLIGMVGRFDPQKDHHNFVQAAIHLHKAYPKANFLLCGLDITWENEVLAAWIPETLRSYFHLLGRRLDVEQIDTALDIGCLSSSHGEGFPMAVGEMMACGVPCAVTDVGDCALLVGDTGRIVPPRDPQALANAWRELIEMGADQCASLGQAARQRVETHFSIPKITAQYEALYQKAAMMPGEKKICVG